LALKRAPVGYVLAAGAVAFGGVALGVRRLLSDAEINRRARALVPPGMNAPDDVFHPEQVALLPEPVQRYFRHALAEGARLHACARLSMRGHMRLSRSEKRTPFQAQEVLVPPRGFVFQASLGRGPLRSGLADWLDGSSAGTRGFSFGLFSSVSASGFDLERASAGRLALESIWAPAALLPGRGARWEVEGPDAIRATQRIAGEPHSVTIAIDGDGRVRAATLLRWGNSTEDGRFSWIPCGLDVDGERVFDGVTVPSSVRGSWWYGSEQAFEYFSAEPELVGG